MHAGVPSSDIDRCLMTSFDSLSLQAFADEWGDAPMGRGLGFHSHDVTSNWRDVAQMLGASMVLIPLEQLTREIVEEQHAAGRLVAGSLLENLGDVRRLVELDIDTSASPSTRCACCSRASCSPRTSRRSQKRTPPTCDRAHDANGIDPALQPRALA